MLLPAAATIILPLLKAVVMNVCSAAEGTGLPKEQLITLAFDIFVLTQSREFDIPDIIGRVVVRSLYEI